MEIVDNNLTKFGLHDAAVNDIFCERSKICFYFDTGIYKLDSTGHEEEKTKACRLNIIIPDLDTNEIYRYVEIKKIYKGKVRELRYDELLHLIKNNVFDISMGYYSWFGKSILLNGYMGKYQIEIIITDIDSIYYSFVD